MQEVTQDSAWCNGEVVYLAGEMAHALPDCLGFMVTRVPETGADAGQRRVSPTWLAFSNQSNPQWIEQDSSVWPIQSFQWRDRLPRAQGEQCMPPATSFFGRVSIATHKRQTLTEVYGFVVEQI
jgi:hypothetical protein